ncbi:MAG: S8 family serine peptidase [bacterium]|nr:S8 family serine peptidase [bacterium]
MVRPGLWWSIFLAYTAVAFALPSVRLEPREVPQILLVKTTSTTSLDRLHQISGVERVTPLATASAIDNSPLSQWYKIVTSSQRESEVLAAIRANGDFTEAYQMRRFIVDAAPSPDSLSGNQWALSAIQANTAWQTTTGTANIVLGVIDTGTELDHPDLASQLWFNRGEDFDRNGVLSPADSNGFDDDGNGYIDDFIGYDFTDAAGFPTGGDDITPDNNPSDEMGHGTAVASVALAAANWHGIIGLAPNIKLMTLRAGNANGYLEEDDVAAAILYAAENGANVVNMSFGDVVVAPVLRDAIEYARSRNVLMTASSGNTGQNATHFPSGYEAVISVGASDQTGRRASLSSYGSSIDLIAPGVDILAAKLDHLWDYTNGTSFSSPYVAAAACLILSVDSTLNPSEVQTILCTSADDIGTTGWDIETGHGILNAGRAVGLPQLATARILSPADGASVNTDTVTITGTVAGPRLLSWSLYLGVGQTPSQWQVVLASVTQQRVREKLATVTLPAGDTVFTIRLTADVSTGGTYESRIAIRRDITPPLILRRSITPALINGRWGWRVEMSTDDQSDCHIRWIRNGTIRTKQFSYIDNEHALTLLTDDNALPGDSIAFIAKNLSGLITTSMAIIIPPLPPAPITLPLVEIPANLPAGYLLPKLYDWDRDNREELLVTGYTNEFDYDTLRLLENNNTQFDSRVTYGRQVAQDAADITGDGKPELMIRAYGITWFLTSSATVPYPLYDLIPPDTNQSYGAMLYDFDPTDRVGNFILRREKAYEVWNVNWNNSGNYTPEMVYRMTNTTPGENLLGKPRVRIGDVNGDGTIEALWGDSDGNVLLWRRVTDRSWVRIWADTLIKGGNATDYLDIAKPVSGQMSPFFVAGCENADALTTEHEAPLRKWVFYLYHWIGNRPQRTDSLVIDGAFSPREFDSGIETGDLDGDGQPEVFITAYPNLLVMQVDSVTHNWRIVYRNSLARSNAVVLTDINRNGRKELAYNDGAGFRFLEWQGGDPGTYPLIPTGAVAQPLDTNRIRVSWGTVEGATSYWLLRAENDIAQFDTLSRTLTDTVYIDSNASDTTLFYRYMVAAYNPALPAPLSGFSVVVTARPNRPPQIQAVHYDSDEYVRVEFTEPIASSSIRPVNFRLNDSIAPVSILSSQQGRQVVLRFIPRPAAGTYRLSVERIFDLDNTPLAGADSALFEFPPVPAHVFFVQNAWIENGAILVSFSLPYDQATATLAAFSVSPGVDISSIQFVDSVSVRLLPSHQTPVGNYGVVYEVEAHSPLRSITGTAIDPDNSVRAISYQPTELTSVFVYPNPARPAAGERIVFAGVPKGTRITIFTVSGIPVREITADPISGGAYWDGKNESGETVAAGVYLYIAYTETSQTRGKVAIIR